MDIGRYINSKDIRDYLNVTGYNFNSLEAAWLIFQCRDLSLKERHNAWKELMTVMPDCEMPKEGKSHGGSLFSYLQHYMSRENDMYDAFVNNDRNCVYYHTGQYKEEDGTNCECFDFDPFSSVDTCIESLFMTYGVHDYDYITITKQYMDGGGESSLILKGNREVYAISEYSLLGDHTSQGSELPSAFFEFPLPYKKGDIVYNPSESNPLEQRPFVFMGLNKGESGIAATGYRVNYGGQIRECNVDDYMNLEYYKKPLEKNTVTLIFISKYLKGEINLVNYSNGIMANILNNQQLY